MSQVLVLNGPNLNLLGTREPARYGEAALATVEANLREQGERLGVAVDCFQSNSEAALIDRVHAAATDGTAALIVNPAAFTHSSIALRDALLAVALPFVEVHVSNVHRREPFRHHSYFSDIAEGTITGLGVLGYRYALDALVERLGQPAGATSA